ncbi:MAG: signal peptidase II [Pseudarcicella sp.]|nr:signal peptidase II [Pseudarcicella sp.]
MKEIKLDIQIYSLILRNKTKIYFASMSMPSTKRISIVSLLVIFNIFIDQLSKYFVRQNLELHETHKYFFDLCTLTKTENTGAFLSLGSNIAEPYKSILLNLMPCLVMVYMLYFVFTKTDLSKWMVFAISCIIGGGLANLYDRLKFGSVTDFLHINFVVFDLQTGVFNVADMSIMLGMFIFLFNGFFNEESKA